ncbi:phosphatidylethanolamine N-methyltransferase isoform X2 [Varanus komodoensis]|uniref:Phosphatidylethanolamine N-methyltransferase n=1 Tax=Varanus komodoensis TaxID=61221 RepID=A0A8D2Q8L6_VARKO|nr:phosphatidylethanolamine N-methyltransferase isoform X2 [Varanus komodoensis]
MRLLLPLDCCEALSNVDYSKVDPSIMSPLLDYVDVTDSRFVAALLCIAFNPLFWNLVGRWEHKTRSLTHVFRSPYMACYCLGAVIVTLNFLRSHWRLLRHPQGGEGDVLPVQYPGQSHVLGQHHHLPGLVHHARKPSWSRPDSGRGAVLCGCVALRRAFHGGNLSPKGTQEQIRVAEGQEKLGSRRQDDVLPPTQPALRGRIVGSDMCAQPDC